MSFPFRHFVVGISKLKGVANAADKIEPRYRTTAKTQKDSATYLPAKFHFSGIVVPTVIRLLRQTPRTQLEGPAQGSYYIKGGLRSCHSLTLTLTVNVSVNLFYTETLLSFESRNFLFIRCPKPPRPQLPLSPKKPRFSCLNTTINV